MLKYKCCICDMDGTLLNSEEKISKENEKALKRLQKDGVKVIIASGRPDFFLKPYIKQLNLKEYAVCYNGSLIRNVKTWDKFYFKIINSNIVKKILNYCINNNLNFIVCTEYTMYSSIDNSRAKIYCNSNRNLTIDMKIPIQFVDSKIINYISDMEVLKILLVCNNKDIILFKKYFSYLNSITLVSSLSGFLDIMASNISKGNAIKILSKKLNIDLRKFIAFGDNHNDIEMLKSVGMPIAMKNSTDDVKSIAKYVTKSNNESGIAYAINNIIY